MKATSRFALGIVLCAVVWISLSYRSQNERMVHYQHSRFLEVTQDNSASSTGLDLPKSTTEADIDNLVADEEDTFARRLSISRLRVATFGSAMTWGLGVGNRYQSYPYLLSSNVDNYAFFSAGPNYPAVCTQSMIGDNAMYDLIVFEYRMRANEGLFDLAKRLRQRFPHALMFFLLLETPKDIRRKERNNETNAVIVETLDQWHQRLNANLPWSLLRQSLHEDKGEWLYPPRSGVDSVVEEAASTVGGEIIRFPIDKLHPKSFLIHNWEFYNEHRQLTEAGHQWLATQILNRTHAIYDANPVDPTESIELGRWDDPDSCHLWFTTGGCNLEYDTNALHMLGYDDYRGKYALEVLHPGWIKPRNPHDEHRELYVSFMASGPGVYPKTNATWVGSDGQVYEATLDPVTSHDTLGAHVVRTIPLGMMSYGTKTLSFEPLETTKFPFRLVGVSFVGDVAPLEYDFAPFFNA